MLPDEIISEILSPALKVPEELFSDTSDVSPFSNYAPSTSAYLVVCKDWLRVATPLLYTVVVLRSTAQANALAMVLKQNPEFGRFVKKLRVEGGYGPAMHTILKATPDITDLFLSWAIWASDSTSGLCRGLPLVNPRRVILVDPWVTHPLKNQQLGALKETVLSCLRSWKNMRIFNHPYGSRIANSNPVWGNRALDLQKALLESRVHTIILGSAFTMIPWFLYFLCDIPSLEALQFQRPFEEHAGRLVAMINANSKLKKLAKYTLHKNLPENKITYGEPDVTPSLNPNFIPMQSASDETRENVWKRVLFFAMYVEELRSPSFSRSPTDSHPSRLPILCVSKYFHRLALPYLYECVQLTPQNASGIQTRLQEQPHLGTLICRVFTTSEQLPSRFSTDIRDATRCLFRHATNLEVFIPVIHDRRQRVSAEALDLLAKTAGHSIQGLSVTMDSMVISASSLKSFTALRVLEIGGFKLLVSPQGFSSDALKTLHTLRIHTAVLGNIFGIFASARLESLHTLRLPEYPTDDTPLSKLVQVHGQKLLHLTMGPGCASDFPALYLCPNLIELEILGDCDLVKLTPRVPHNSLAKLIAQSVPMAIKEMELNQAMFPALREIQIRELEWPTNERDISKSKVVPLAESLLQRNIKLTNDEGKHWVPRLKTGRARKGA